jgi:hypothetical protein
VPRRLYFTGTVMSSYYWSYRNGKKDVHAIMLRRLQHPGDLRSRPFPARGRRTPNGAGQFARAMTQRISLSCRPFLDRS